MTTKTRVFYRYFVTHMNRQGRSIKPTGVTFRVDLRPEEDKILFSAAVSNLGSRTRNIAPDHFVRAEGRAAADKAWEEGRIFEITYSAWPDAIGVVDVIYDALVGMDANGLYNDEPYAVFTKEPEDAERFKVTLRQRLEFPRYTGTLPSLDIAD